RLPRRRSNANSRRPLAWRRAWRRARAEARVSRAASGASAAGTCAPSLEDPDAVRGPVGGEGASDDPARGDRAPEAAVVGFATVVAHHEPVPGGNLDRGAEVALPGAAALPDVAVGLALAVADHVPFDDRDHIARSGHDPLDEV